MLFYQNLKIRYEAVELSCLAKGEYQGALVGDMTAGLIDLGLEGKGAFHLIVCLVLRTYDIQRLGTQFLLHLSVHQEACHLVVSLYGKGVLLASRNTIVERVEVSLSPNLPSLGSDRYTTA